MDIGQQEVPRARRGARGGGDAAAARGGEARSAGVASAVALATSALGQVRFSRLPDKWRNYFVRCVTGFLMIIAFSQVVRRGPLAVALLVLFLDLSCFFEQLRVAVAHLRPDDWFVPMSWYYFAVAHFYLHCDTFTNHLGGALFSPHAHTTLLFCVQHSEFVTFWLYMAGFVYFTFTLTKRLHMKSFAQFAWIHCSIIAMPYQAHMMVRNSMQGVIWFVLPTSLIICNDICAYLCGFFIGRTPLISVSPKKTWEGFVGGVLGTVAFALAFSQQAVQAGWMVCPAERGGRWGVTVNDSCARPPLFPAAQLPLPQHPFLIHAILIALVISLVGPFGGFFASAFKRAVDLKDFGAVIPGHGGFIDRFDCTYLMATFVRLYWLAFVGQAPPSGGLSTNHIVASLLQLPADQQLAVSDAFARALANSTSTSP